MSVHTHTIQLDGGQDIILETGVLAVQANGAVTARCGDTIVLAAVVSGPADEEIDYFPLQVEYRERHYAGGVISSSRFIKREGRPSDREILTSRLIDRSIRPLFPKNYFDTVQVVVTPLSIDGQTDPAILGLIATSAALTISDIPWSGPVGAALVGLDQNNQFLINPGLSQDEASSLHLVVSGAKGSIAMVEAGAKEVTEDKILSAMQFAQKHIDTIVDAIDEFSQEISKTKKSVNPAKVTPEQKKLIDKYLDAPKLLSDAKAASGEGIKYDHVVTAILADNPDVDKNQIARLIDDKIREHFRSSILTRSIRIDGRKFDEIRDIEIAIGLLPRTHGSALFKRGLTHALSVVTLGSPSQEQLIEGMNGEETKRYMHHYNMPGYATGEPGRIGTPNRRETGHGALAEKALLPVIPDEDIFPYTIRIVSEIMSGNGSTSQASVCGSTLSLMDAGVPIKKPVAGIAMGLISEAGKYITLSDIAGPEDHYGDMDFKVAGTADGVTAMQMDIKVPGVTAKILEQALEQARQGRLFILSKMLAVIDKPRPSLSQYAPNIATLKIDSEKIGEIIGPGGRMIRLLQQTYTVEIDIDDSGKVSITGNDPNQVEKAKNHISGLVTEAEIGKTYEGTVTRVESFGAFVDVLPGKSGLVHVSRMGKGVYVSDASQVVSVGDTVTVRADEIDDRGRLNLSLLSGGRTPSSDSPQHQSSYQSNRPAPSSPGKPQVFKRFRDHR